MITDFEKDESDITMWLRARPLRSMVSRKLGYWRSIQQSAIESIIEQEEETEKNDHVYYLSGQLGKAIRGSTGPESLAFEIDQATRGEIVHDKVIRFTLENCLIHSAGFEYYGGNYHVSPFNFVKDFSSRIKRVPSALFCMTGVSHTFFGHWLQDACATALLKRNGEALLLANRTDWPHAAQYLEAFAFDPAAGSMLLVERLTIYQDYSQGSHKRQRYLELRRRLEQYGGRPAQRSRRVYFRRGSTGVSRVIDNEDILIDNLKNRGFEVFDLAGASARDINERFRNVECVVSVDGSHLNHLYFTMPHGSKLMTIVPADCFTMNQIGYCKANSIIYGFVVGDPVNGGYSVTLTDVNSTLDLMSL